MKSDYASLPAITKRSFDFTVYPAGKNHESDNEIFEARTERLSRCHLQGIVTSRTSFLQSADSKQFDEKITVKFHAISSVLNQIHGHIFNLEKSADFQNRPIVEIEFTREINILEL